MFVVGQVFQQLTVAYLATFLSKACAVGYSPRTADVPPLLRIKSCGLCLSVSVFVCLSVCISCLPACLSVSLPAGLSVCVCLSLLGIGQDGALRTLCVFCLLPTVLPLYQQSFWPSRFIQLPLFPVLFQHRVPYSKCEQCVGLVDYFCFDDLCFAIVDDVVVVVAFLSRTFRGSPSTLLYIDKCIPQSAGLRV